MKAQENKSEQGLALEAFEGCHNCSQSVLLAFANRFSIPKETCLQVASGFGGGIAMSGNLCGALSGGIMVLGLAGTGEGESKKVTYDKSKRLLAEFETRYGSTECKTLTIPRENSEDKAFCNKFVEGASVMVTNLLND